jgi:hypothetical protein
MGGVDILTHLSPLLTLTTNTPSLLVKDNHLLAHLKRQNGPTTFLSIGDTSHEVKN